MSKPQISSSAVVGRRLAPSPPGRGGVTPVVTPTDECVAVDHFPAERIGNSPSKAIGTQEIKEALVSLGAELIAIELLPEGFTVDAAEPVCDPGSLVRAASTPSTTTSTTTTSTSTSGAPSTTTTTNGPTTDGVQPRPPWLASFPSKEVKGAFRGDGSDSDSDCPCSCSACGC